MSGAPDAELVEFLKQRGHTDDEIQMIVRELNDHDDETVRESVFDSIAAGTFNLDAVIKKALGKDT